MALGLYGYPGGPRRYLACGDPHTLLSSGRLHVERMSFNNLQHMLYYWAHRLYDAAFDASIEALFESAQDDARQQRAREERRREAWSKVAGESEMVLMLAEGAEVTRPIADVMIHRALDAGRAAAAFFMETDKDPNDEEFYPWFDPGSWGTGDFDADRAADLAELERIVCDRLGIPEYQRKLKLIELRPGEKWY